MPKQPTDIIPDVNKNEPSPKPSANKSLAKPIDKALFSPTVRQQQVKAVFWNRFNPGLLSGDVMDLSAAEVERITRSSSVSKWWSTPGFKEWLLNVNTQAEKVEFLYELGLQSMVDLFTNEEAPWAAKVNAFKAVNELANKLPKNKEVIYSDADVNNMSKKQLEQYLSKTNIKVVEEKVIDVSSEEPSDG